MLRALLVGLIFLSGSAWGFQPRTGHWWNPAESGRGFNIDIQNGVMVMTMYTYDSGGNAQWYLAAGPMTNGQRSFSATLDRYVGGQCIACSYQPATLVGNDGVVTVAFASEISATVTFPGGHVSNIQPFDFGFGALPAGLTGEWVYVYDIITTFADRFDYSTIRAATPNGSGTIWDDERNAACELQISGTLAGQVVCFQWSSLSSPPINSYAYVYGLDETFNGVWISQTATGFAMKGFRVKGSEGYAKAASAKRATVIGATAVEKAAQQRAAPGDAVAHSSAITSLAAEMRATRPW